MLRISLTELNVLLAIAIGGGQLFALAYSHDTWSWTTCLVLAYSVVVILAIVLRVFKRSRSPQLQDNPARQQ